MDTAHGRMNFSFDVGQRIMDQGILPHCISTDLTVPGRVLTVHSMTEMMTRFMAMGFTLEQVVTMCTINPARAIGEDHRLGSLEVGREADVSVLEMKQGDWVVYDVLGDSLKVDRDPDTRLDPEAWPDVRARLGSSTMGLGPGPGRVTHVQSEGLCSRAGRHTPPAAL